MFFHFCKLSIKFTPNPTQRTSHTHARTHKYKHQIYIRNIYGLFIFWLMTFEICDCEWNVIVDKLNRSYPHTETTYTYACASVCHSKVKFSIRIDVKDDKGFTFKTITMSKEWIKVRVTSAKSKTKSHEMKKIIFKNFDIHTKLIERTHFSITHRINKTKQHIILYKRIVVENFK